ncbi:NlpC/P60 family protein [Streptomyces sp. ME02-8801-2C]|uniref:C40 family peptidase n=1 Tax=Streptomyces sp. ME02-8801-2C TaxID=3028680 RepID=UPI0029A64761|nr:NlpC/P60 family protein [Streptomyces sp. ME02-8801-2C]MDX3450350.1 NlpC/P60 family protein [Streptomyces sp. ME02-8801-2C]
MASHRRPKQPSRTRVTVLTTAAAAAVALSANAANAAPSEKPSMDEVKAKVDKLYEQTEQASEKLNGAEEKQDRLEKEISTLQDNVARGQADLNDLRDSLGLAAAAQYRTGSIDPSVQLFLSADPDDYLDKASTMDQLSSQQVETLKKVTEKQRALAQQRSEATEKLKDLADTRSELAKKKKEVQSKLTEARQLLNSMTAAQRAAIAAADARASRASERSALDGGGSHVTGRAGSAYAVAQSKIGSPYVYSASGPNTFDCSGFTSWSFAQVGIHIPRTSQDQANAGTRIYSQSDLQVGDLVIFYSDHHHVGFYAGNGQVLHAPRSGTVVRYESIDNMPFQFGVRI